jgi:HSP20 family molecular chaperone IbpA
MATLTTRSTPDATRHEPAGDRARPTVAPRVDIYETEKAYVLLADMPGVAPSGLDVEAERDTLVIRGRVERPSTPPDYQEFELADYYRVFSLTEDLDTGAITAALRDGVLRVEVPKSVQMQPKKIPVRSE